MKKSLYILSILIIMMTLTGTIFVGAIFTPYTGNHSVAVTSEQLYTKKSFFLQFEELLRAGRNVTDPWIKTPSNITTFINRSDTLCAINSTSGEEYLFCWYEYQFNEEGIYIHGYIDTSNNESIPTKLMKVEDNLGINKIWHQIRKILDIITSI